MRKWKVLAAVLATLTVSSSLVQAQEDLQLEVQRMKAQLEAQQAKIEAQDQKINQLESSTAVQDDAVLESQINALTARVQGTTVKSAANPVTLSGEFRFRNSWSLGDNAPGGTPVGSGSFGGGAPDEEHGGSWTDALVRLGFQYDFTRDISAYAELQAHWGFGSGVSTNSGLGTPFGAGSEGKGTGGGGNPAISSDFGATTTIRAHQAWLEIRNLFNRPEFSSRVGRQEITLGNQFQFGNADWYNGFAFDGARWDWNSESFSLTGMLLTLTTDDLDPNQNPSFFRSHDDDELYSIYFTLKTIPDHQLDIYWIYVNGHGGAFDNGSGVSNGSLGNFVGDPAFIGTAYYHTVGARIGGVFSGIAAGLDWNFEVAYQFGENKGPGFEFDISALALEGEVGLTFDRTNMFRIWLRGLYAEGPDDDELGYIPLYPNRHSNGGFRARYGIFDLVPMTNVLALTGGLHFDPDPAWTLGLSALWATTNDTAGISGRGIAIGPGAGVPDEDYGFEVDIWGEYRYSNHLVFNAGVALIFADEALEALWFIDDDLQFYGYLQARLLF